MNSRTEQAFANVIDMAETFNEEFNNSVANAKGRQDIETVSLFKGLAFPMYMGEGRGEGYTAENGVTLQREDYVVDGRLHRGVWVLRHTNREVVDFDVYRHDIAERNGLNLIAHEG